MINQFLGGPREVVLGFVLSAEYQRMNSGSTAFVQVLYKDLLLRNADSAELQFWSETLRDAGSQATALSIMALPESLLRIIDGYYAALLHRAGEKGGRDFWFGKFTSDEVSIETGAIGFLAGTLNIDEYFRSAQASVS